MLSIRIAPIFAAALSACAAWPSVAAPTPAVDRIRTADHVSGSLTIGRRTIALPNGDWELIAKSERNPSTFGANQRPSLVRLHFQEIKEGRLNRILEVAATTFSAQFNWEDEPCKAKGDSYWIEDRRTGSNDQFCLRVGFNSAMVDGARGDSFVAWTQDLKAKSVAYSPEMPFVTVTRFTPYDFLSMSISFNPAAQGIEKSKDPSRPRNDWNGSRVTWYEERWRFYEALKSWAPTFAAAVQRAFDGDETLSGKDFAEPALPRVP